MNGTLEDIEDLKQAQTLLEGASDEKRAGLQIIENMIATKEAEVNSYEKQMDLFCADTVFK